MLVPTFIMLVVLLVALIGGLYVAKKRFIDHERPSSDLRPDDRLPESHPDLTNPPIYQPGLSDYPDVPPERLERSV